MRITFLGGGTDFPSVFNRHDGAAIYAAIDKYVYVSTLHQPIFVKDKYKFTYRITESVSSIHELKHPVVREALKLLNWEQPINISTMADLPGDSGLGSSSAFTASLIQNLLSLKGAEIEEKELAKMAIKVEREILLEAGGWQDQIATAFGGLRMIKFSDNNFELSENSTTPELIEYLEERTILLRVSGNRNGIETSQTNEQVLNQKSQEVKLQRLVDRTKQTWINFQEATSVKDKFKVLQESIYIAWQNKKELGSHVANKEVETTENYLKELGIRHFKLIGAGGGGFFLIMENPEKIGVINTKFKTEDLVRFRISEKGTKTIRYE